MKLMKKLCVALFLTGSFFATSQEEEQLSDEAVNYWIDSVESSLKYQTGTIHLKNGIGKVIVPKGYKYLDVEQSKYVLTTLFGNPPSVTASTMGLLVPKNMPIMADDTYVFNLEYEPIGYVEDDDAADIDYTELLTSMQAETRTESIGRVKAGYPGIKLVGWASAPFYNSSKHVLHWAQEIKFDDVEVNTLNYNVRILGRKGVFVMNAISIMPSLPMVKKDIPKILQAFHFAPGNTYGEFDSGVDEVAAWTIGGLVAGKVLAKVGFWVLILKFWKIIAVAVAGAGTYIWKRIKRKKEEEEIVTYSARNTVPSAVSAIETETPSIDATTSIELDSEEKKDENKEGLTE